MTTSTLHDNTVSSGSGGIGNAGTVTVTDSVLSRNAADSSGGIDNLGLAMVLGSRPYGNVATRGDSGGIYNQGTLTVMRSVFGNNAALHRPHR